MSIYSTTFRSGVIALHFSLSLELIESAPIFFGYIFGCRTTENRTAVEVGLWRGLITDAGIVAENTEGTTVTTSVVEMITIIMVTIIEGVMTAAQVVKEEEAIGSRSEKGKLVCNSCLCDPDSGAITS